MFIKAVPIWLKNLRTEVNLQAIFTSHFNAKKGNKYILNITGATLYRVFLNKQFIHYGPARAPHGYARVDKIDVTDYVVSGENIIVIEIAGYNCPSFYTINQKSFVCAEILENQTPCIYTGKDFSGFIDTRRIQKCLRYSYQRTFTEHWALNKINKQAHECEQVCVDLNFLPREVPYPKYSKKYPVCIGDVSSFDYIQKECKGDRYLYECEEGFVHFTLDDISFNPLFELQKIQMNDKSNNTSGYISGGEYVRVDMGMNTAGFISSGITAYADSRIIIAFDEKLINDTLNTENWQCANVITCDLAAQNNEQALQSFECYGFRYAWIIVLNGKITLNEFCVTEYVTPDINNISLNSNDEELIGIFEAAKETYRQNTLDLPMDCPTRERAGWLCDSYFSAQSEMFFSGDNKIERVFLENFALAKEFPNIPKGMLSMCYPADHYNGAFIPQWALWYIVQLEQYKKRSCDNNMERFRKLCYGLIGYLSGFENEYGLLEKIPGCNFIEWSDANSYVDDVSYPTNMLYFGALKAMGIMFGDDTLTEKAENLKKTIVKQSFDGVYFVDNARRNSKGELVRTNNRSEVCQYYAFFFNIAEFDNPDYSALVNIITKVFGPKRKEKNELPEIALTDAFVGNCLRMEILMNWGAYEQVLNEVKLYYANMAHHTGTLWEQNDISCGSLNQGFESFIGVVIYNCVSKRADK